ncbi:hypothetical protein GCM10020000_87260 [Streptomyces olivoverticillatus]
MPVAAPDAHITVLHDGPLQDFAPGEIEKITELVRTECADIAPFDITLDRPAIGRVAIECPGRPGRPARRLWELTARASAEVTGSRFPRVPSAYQPHLSIGYSTSTATVRADRAAMKVWLSDCPRGPVTLTATALNLVAQWHTCERITWDHLVTIPPWADCPPAPLNAPGKYRVPPEHRPGAQAVRVTAPATALSHRDTVRATSARKGDPWTCSGTTSSPDALRDAGSPGLP